MLCEQAGKNIRYARSAVCDMLPNGLSRCTYRIDISTSKKQFYILFIPFISVFIFPQFYSYFPKIYLQYHRFKGYYIFIFANMQQVKNASIVLSFLLVSLSAYNSPPLKSPTWRLSKCSEKYKKPLISCEISG